MKAARNISKRLLTQIVFFLLQNPLLQNFSSGQIYRGELKQICTPGLNCYSCPAAVTSCPIGALQLFLAGAKQSLSLFVTGFLLCTAALFGRLICGYVCPMGLLQDLMYKVKTPKLRAKLRYLRYLKYAVLIIFVVTLPLLIRNELSGLGSPWFCKYICPSGTIFGAVPLLTVNEFLRSMAGMQFIVKAAVAGGLIVASLFVFRIFCRILCPLGAIYALFNRIAVVRMRCDKDKCTDCGECAGACRIMLEPAKQPNSPECVRCGGCMKKCPSKALRYAAGPAVTQR